MDTRTVIVVAIIAAVISNIWIVRTKIPAISPRKKAIFTIVGLVVITGLTVPGYFSSN